MPQDGPGTAWQGRLPLGHNFPVQPRDGAVERLTDQLRTRHTGLPRRSVGGDIWNMEGDPLTQEQLRGLGMLLHMALKEIRLLGWDDKAEQSADLADALCQLPLRMHSDSLGWEQYEQNLNDYEQRYPDRKVKIDYARMLRRIMTSE